MTNKQKNKIGDEEMLKSTYTTEYKTITESVGVALGALYGYIAGLDYKTFLVLIVLMVLDIINGVLFSLKNGQFKSSKMKEGLIMKMLLLILLMALTFFQIILIDYGIELPFANSIAGIMAFMEMFSIIETFVNNGVKLPKSIIKWFEDANDKLYDED